MGGWVITVKIQCIGGGWSEPQQWCVAIENQIDAENAVKNAITDAHDGVEIETAKAVPDEALQILKLERGKLCVC